MNSEPRPPSAPAPIAAVGHTGDHEDLAALYALDALDGDELVLFARHLGSCPRCRDVLAGDRLAVAALGAAAPEREASPDFKARLLERAERELTARPRRIGLPTGSSTPSRGGPGSGRLAPAVTGAGGSSPSRPCCWH